MGNFNNVTCERLNDDGTCKDDGEACDLCEGTIESMGEPITVTESLYNAVVWGIEKLSERPSVTFMSGMLGGGCIGIGCLLSMMVRADASLTGSVANVLSGVLFSVGLFLTFACGGELFTGNCLTHAGFEIGTFRLRDCARTIVMALIGNIAGVLYISVFASWCEFGLEGVASGLVAAKNATDVFQLFMRGLVCNILVCAGTWISANSRDTLGKLVAALVPVTAFVALGCEHGVADMFYVAYASCGGDGMANAIAESLPMLLFVSVGNVVGGAWWFSALAAHSNE